LCIYALAVLVGVAAGVILAASGVRARAQDKIKTHGYAIQCRITTEDPTANFRPDTGIISVYRSAHGHGIRLDEGPGYVGAHVSPHYDSLLVKVIAHDATWAGALAKERRALREHRIRGVTTNIPFLVNVLDHEDFKAGVCTTRCVRRVVNVAFGSRPHHPCCPRVLCCAVLCCAVLCCAVLCCAVLCCAVLCCAVLSLVGG
jgi:pyruvate carboxylase